MRHPRSSHNVVRKPGIPPRGIGISSSGSQHNGTTRRVFADTTREYRVRAELWRVHILIHVHYL